MSGSLRAILRPQRWTLRSGPQGPAGDTGGAGVTSVNGDEGPEVTLDAADVGALAVSGLGSVTQAWSANLDSYATTPAQTSPLASRIPRTTANSPRLSPGWLRTYAGGTPTADEDADAGYVVGDQWVFSVTGRVYHCIDVAADNAVWVGALIASDATATPTASKIPIADGAGKLAAGWIPTGSGGVQAWDADLDAYAANPATATPTASRIPVADGSGLLDGWISTASTSTAGLAKVRPTNITLMGRQTVITVNNIPAAETEIPAAGAVRSTFDLTNFTQFRLKVNQVAASSSGSVCRVLYSTTPDGTPAIGTMSDLAATPTAGDCALSTTGTQTTQVGPWTNIAAGAKTDAQMALVTALGNATADPTFRWGELELR